MKKLALSTFVCVALVGLSACADTVDRQVHTLGEQTLRHGVVSAIDDVELDGSHPLGIGAVVGAAAGGVIGHQVGRGSGRDVATVLGAIGGGLAGGAAQNRVDRTPGQRIVVRLESGTSISITQLGNAQLRVGDRVDIRGEGRDARVVRG